MPIKVTEDDMSRVLWRHFKAAGWSIVPQVSTVDHDEEHFAGLRRIDMLAVRRNRTTGTTETLALEIKVDKSDFKRDMDNPGKQQAWRMVANRHAYVVPAGMLYRDEVPPGSGLLTVAFNGSMGYGMVEWAKPAPNSGDHRLADATIRAMFFRLSDLEGKTRGWNVDQQLSGNTDDLRAALVAANRLNEQLARQVAKAEGQRDSWRELYARTHVKGAPCAWCGEPVKPLRPSQGWFGGFRHLDKGHDALCEALEREATAMKAREEYAASTDEARARALRRADFAYHSTGQEPTPAQLEAEPWRAFMPRADHPLKGAWPADLAVVEEA